MMDQSHPGVGTNLGLDARVVGGGTSGMLAKCREDWKEGLELWVRGGESELPWMWSHP